MNKPRTGLLAVLMMTAALAGCVGEDTSDLDAQIDDLNNMTTNLTQTLEERDVAISELDTLNTELTQTIAERDVAISELEATIAGHESNIAGLEAAMTLMEEQRDSLLAQLSDSQEFANQTIALAEAMNETIAGLHAMLGENATQVQQLQTDLAEQQDLVAQWQQTAEDNRADLKWAVLVGADLGGTDLSGADLRGIALSNAELSYADLSGTEMAGAYLDDAVLYYADLSGAYLSGADLRYADLRYADLTGAGLYYADLRGAYLSGANLSGVDWYSTTCPDGTNSDDNGDTCENNL